MKHNLLTEETLLKHGFKKEVREMDDWGWEEVSFTLKVSPNLFIKYYDDFSCEVYRKTKEGKEISILLDWEMTKLEEELFKIVYVLTGKELENI
jgi:hypothetical protein